MGLFSSHRNTYLHQKAEPDHCKVFVFARASADVPEHGEGSIEPVIQWSLAVEAPRHRRASQPPIEPRKKGLFSTKRRESKPDRMTVPIVQSEASYPSDQLRTTEFRLSEGSLEVLQDNNNIDNHKITSVTDSETSSPLMLLKIHVRHLPQSLPGTQTLTTKTEQVLQQMTASNPALTNEQSEVWIKYALLSLQHAGILPSGHAFNVNDFINYVQNKTTEFEAEAMAASHHQDQASNGHHRNLTYSEDLVAEPDQFVREVDYQRHLDENTRLRALFGHQRVAVEFDDDDTDDSRPASTRFTETDNGGRGASGEGENHHHNNVGGFWVTRPNAARQHQQQHLQHLHQQHLHSQHFHQQTAIDTRSMSGSNVYGGLM